MGYDRSDFVEAWDRYLASDTPLKTSTPLQPTFGAGYSDFQTSTSKVGVENENGLKTTTGGACRGVEGLAPLQAEEDGEEI